MIWSCLHLRGYKLGATDGTIGDVDDFLFVDRTWQVRYLVADTSRWLAGRKVLIATTVLGEPNFGRRELPVDLSKQKIKDSPSVETTPGITPREEALLHEHYGWSPQWGGQGVPLAGYEAGIIPPSGISDHLAVRGSITLHTMEELEGLRLEATDGDVGDVEDVLVDEGWRIRYLAIDTGRRLPAKETVVAVDWLRTVDWGGRRVTLPLSREDMRDSPTYDPKLGIGREYEERLYGHYHRPGYWAG